VALYGLWYLRYGEGGAELSNLGRVPGYIARSAEGTVGSVIGSGPGTRATAAALVVAGAVLAAVRFSRWTPRLGGAAAGLLVFWGLTSLTRGSLGEPAASRYLYPGAVFLLLLILELASVIPIHRPRLVAAILSLLVLGAAHSNLEAMRHGASGLRDVSTYVRAELGALELAGRLAPPDLQPDVVRMPQVEAAKYLDAVANLGSMADRPSELTRRGPQVRMATDDLLLRILLARGDAAVLEQPDREEHGTCRSVRPGSAEIGGLDTPLVMVRTGPQPAQVWLRRFGPAFADDPLLSVPPMSTAQIRWASRLRSQDWRMRLDSTGDIEWCTLG
jgi:hypothetical protein